MAEDGMPDDDLTGLLDWIYVEDDFPLADELAESQIPDPGYAGTRYELALQELEDFDVFDYWDDLQYGDDSYWDYDSVGAQAGSKRKRVASDSSMDNNAKRKRISLIETSGDNVRFVNWTLRKEMAARKLPFMHNRPAFALFPDWKHRFANDDGVTSNTEMPAAMKIAAEGRHEDSGQRVSNTYSSFASAEEDAHHETEVEKATDDLQAGLANLDPEMLKSILRQKLGDAGLKGMDENALMQMMHKMLSGEDDADDAEDELTHSVIDRATQGNDAALSGWLSRQGVSLDAVGGDDEADSMTTPEAPQAVGELKKVENMKSSPSDSAIEMQKAIVGGSAELAIHPPSPTELAKKRAAPSTDWDGQESRKRKKVSFDVPSPSGPIAVSEENGVTKEDAEEHPNLPVTKDPVISEVTINDDNIQVTNTRAEDTISINVNENSTVDTIESNAAGRSKHAEANVDTNAEADEGEDEIVVAPAPAKNTRKRKAEADKAPPKKQAKKASGPTEAAGRRTRSTRSATRAGK